MPQGKGRTKEQKWEKYYTPELKELVRKKTGFFLKCFPNLMRKPTCHSGCIRGDG